MANENNNRNWIATYYNKKNKIIGTEKFFDRSEREADREAGGLAPYGCDDWTLIPIE